MDFILYWWDINNIHFAQTHLVTKITHFNKHIHFQNLADSIIKKQKTKIMYRFLKIRPPFSHFCYIIYKKFLSVNQILLKNTELSLMYYYFILLQYLPRHTSSSVKPKIPIHSQDCRTLIHFQVFFLGPLQ